MWRVIEEQFISPKQDILFNAFVLTSLRWIERKQWVLPNPFIVRQRM